MLLQMTNRLVSPPKYVKEKILSLTQKFFSDVLKPRTVQKTRGILHIFIVY